MAGQPLVNEQNRVVGYIDYHDGEGSAVVNGREYRWEFHEWGGPIFLRKDGEPFKRTPGENHPVWKAFDEWLKQYQKARETASSHEIVSV